MATYTKHIHGRGEYTSVLDLAFATPTITAQICNWQVREDQATGSDHEVIQFDWLFSNRNLVESPFTAPYNLLKADWKLFSKEMQEAAELF